MRQRPQLAFAPAWLLGSALGWSIVPALLVQQSATSYADVAGLSLYYLLIGLFVGVCTALGQIASGLVPGLPGRRWLLATVLGYALAFLAGPALASLISTICAGLRGTFPLLPLTGSGSVSLTHYPTATILGGFVAGAFQWPLLKERLPAARESWQLLWVLGTWLAVGLGLFVGGLLAALALQAGMALAPANVLHGTAWGLTAGAVSVGVLRLLRAEAARQHRPAASS
jgi:hypothetical protein